MRTLAGIILLFTIGAHTVTEAASIPGNFSNAIMARVKRSTGFTISRSNVPRINELRKAFSVATGIKTPDLKWDSRLVERAKRVSTECDNEVQGSDFRFFRAGADENGQVMDIMFYMIVFATAARDDIPKLSEKEREAFAQFEQHVRENPDKVSLKVFELFNPDQTMIGCAHNPCTAELPDEILKAFEQNGMQLKSNVITYSQVCALGLSGNVQSDTLQLVKDKKLDVSGMEEGLDGAKVDVKSAVGSNAQKSDKSSSGNAQQSDQSTSGNAQPVKSSFSSNFIGALLVSVSFAMINMIL